MLISSLVYLTFIVTSRRRHTRWPRDWSSDVCSSDLGYDISRPAATGAEAVQWLYFGYLAAVKEQNGAAMSLGRTSTFLDVYFQRDLREGTLTEQQAQEIIDDFVIKLRIVRFLRTPEYDALFSVDPTWVTERSEEHTSELQSRGHLVCRLLLEKKKK